MKLYAHPGASSLSVHILLHELGLDFDLEVLDVTSKTMADGSDYRAVAPRGLVPIMELDDGTRLSENIVIAQYLCDHAGRNDLMPAAGTIERYRVMEWQSYIASELHKGFSPLFWPIPDEAKAFVIARIEERIALLSDDLGDRTYLTGDTFTAADAYLFVIASWARVFEIDVDRHANLGAYLRRIGQRPSVRAALAAEGPGLVSVD